MCFPSGGPGRTDTSLESKGGVGTPVFQFKDSQARRVPSYPRRVSIFGLFRPSTTCFTQPTDLNVTLIQKHLHGTMAKWLGSLMDRGHKRLAVTTYTDKN